MYRNVATYLRYIYTISYFPASSTRDMLNEWRPLLCPFDTAMMEGAFFLSSFLPTLLLPEERDQGYPLWFDELMGLWDSCRGTWNEVRKIIKIFN